MHRRTLQRFLSSRHTAFVKRQILGQIRGEILERRLIGRHDRAGIIRRGRRVVPDAGGVLEENLEQGLRDLHLVIEVGADDLLERADVVVARLGARVLGEGLPEEDQGLVGGVVRLDRLAELHVGEGVDDVAEVADLLFVAVIVPFARGDEGDAGGDSGFDGV